MKKKYIKPESNMLNALPTTLLTGSETLQSGGGNGNGGPTKVESFDLDYFEEMENEWLMPQ